MDLCYGPGNDAGTDVVIEERQLQPEQLNFSSQVGAGSLIAQLTAGRSEKLLARVSRDIAGPVTGGSMGAAVGSAFGPIVATTGSLLGGALSVDLPVPLKFQPRTNGREIITIFALVPTQSHRARDLAL